jgi:hypothetical protein
MRRDGPDLMRARDGLCIETDSCFFTELRSWGAKNGPKGVPLLVDSRRAPGSAVAAILSTRGPEKLAGGFQGP